MADVGTKLAVTGINEYKSAMREAANSVKTLDQELKRTEAQYKATGDKEQYMTQKSELLDKKLASQKTVIEQAKKALKELERDGVQPTDDAYKRMEQQLISAETAMYKTQTQINAMSNSEKTAAGNADTLTTSLNGISRKVSLEQVIGGIDKITGGLETAAKKAIELGKALFDETLERAAAADDAATAAQMFGIDLQTYKRMQALVAGGMDTTVESILTAQAKLKRGVGDNTKSVVDSLKELGIVTEQFGGKSEEAMEVWATRDPDQLFWMAGKRLMEMGDAFDKEAAATALFGRSWKELVPLFSTFDSFEDYQKALSETTVSSEESTENLAALNDAVSKLQNNFTQLEDEVLGGLAPGLTAAADSLSNLLAKVMDYLQTPEGQEMLDNLSTAVSGLFEDLGNIDPDAVVGSFVEVFDKIVGGVQWLVENKDGVIAALKAIVLGWAGLKLTGGALQVANLINGISGLAGGTAAATAAGTATGAAWGAAFAAAAIPWLAGAVVLLHPSNGDAQQDTFLNPDGTLTTAGQQAFAEGRLTEDGGGTYHNFFTGEDLTPEMYTMTQGTLSSRMRKIVGEAIVPEDPAEVPVVPEAPEDAAEQISAQIGTVPVAVNLEMPHGFGGLRIGEPMMMEHANGLNFVPFDGYPAILHRGERVMPAREVASRSFSSNLYVESMVMNGGADADGLAQAIAARNQRVMAGFGS